MNITNYFSIILFVCLKTTSAAPHKVGTPITNQLHAIPLFILLNYIQISEPELFETLKKMSVDPKIILSPEQKNKLIALGFLYEKENKINESIQKIILSIKEVKCKL